MKKLCFVMLLLMQYSILSAQSVEWALMGSPVSKALGYWNDNPDYSGGFHCGLAAVQQIGADRDSPYGVIDTTGKLIVPYKYKSISNFDRGMAIIETQEGKNGIINTLGNFILSPIYDKIERDEDHPEIYIVEQGTKRGAFYDSQMIVPLKEYQDIDTSYYPNIKLDDGVYNIYSGKLFEHGTILDNHIHVYRDFYTMEGELVPKEKGIISSKGIEWFEDAASKKYGLRNAKTKKVVTAPVYTSIYRDIWIYDRLLAKKNNQYLFIAPDGKELPFKSKYKLEPLQFESGGYLSVTTKDVDADGYGTAMGLLDMNGNCLVEAECAYVNYKNDLGNGWFALGKKDQSTVFNAISRKEFAGSIDRKDISEGVVRSYDIKKHKSFYIDIETGKQIGDYYDYAEIFSEGLAKVGNDRDEHKFINKKGRVVLDLSRFKEVGPYFSEGVIAVMTRDRDRITGYVYNPFGHGNHAYKQKNASNTAINQWIIAADKAYVKNRYGEAKDYYYRVMMNDPKNIYAICRYGYSVYQLGFIEESLEAYAMALDINPKDETAQKNYKIIQQEIENRKAQAAQQKVQAKNKSKNVWKALSNFANVFAQAYIVSKGFNSPTASSMGDASAMDGGSYGGGDTSTSTDTSGSKASSARHYQSMYDRWARNAESNYNSLTLQGAKATSKDGSKHGSSGGFWGSGNYVQLKRNLREAQREMRDVKREASRKGINLRESKWETASVSY